MFFLYIKNSYKLLQKKQRNVAKEVRENYQNIFVVVIIIIIIIVIIIKTYTWVP